MCSSSIVLSINHLNLGAEKYVAIGRPLLACSMEDMLREVTMSLLPRSDHTMAGYKLLPGGGPATI